MSINNYQWKQTAVLPITDGEQFEQIMQYYDCSNISQFCKKILKGEVMLPIPNDEHQDTAQQRLQEYQRVVKDIRAALDRL